jgi:hypothetical protein
MQLSGRWDVGLLPRESHTTKIEGWVTVEGVAHEAPLTGSLSVMHPLRGFNLDVEFADVQGERCAITITANSLKTLWATTVGGSVRGALQRNGILFGDVELRIDLGVILRALPSLKKSP